MLQCYNITMLQYYNVSMLQWDNVTMLQCYVPFLIYNQATDKIFALLADVREFRLAEFPVSFLDVSHCFIIVIAEKGRVSRDQNITNDTDRPHVRGIRHKVIIDHFGWDKLWCPKVHLKPLMRNVSSGQAKIDQFDPMTIRTDTDDVFRLQKI